MKILSVGDIHGRDAWKFHTHGSPYEYNLWRTACDHGAPAISDFWKEMPYMNYDLIIFVGDYVDSFTIKNPEMKLNLEDIIDFKKKMGDRVILLLGNHDIQYIVSNQICSGYRPEMRHDFYKIFVDELDQFTMAHQIGNYLWTHAGVTEGWLKELRKDLCNPSYRFFDIVKERNPATVADEINLAWELRLNTLYNVDSVSGGYNMWAGPLWVRPRVLNLNPLPFITQIVGHTPQATVWSHEVNEHVTHHFIDCIEHGDQQYLELELSI